MCECQKLEPAASPETHGKESDQVRKIFVVSKVTTMAGIEASFSIVYYLIGEPVKGDKR